MADRARVVVGVDGSAGARTALEFALAEAARRDADLDVVSVVPVPEYWPVGIGMASSTVSVPTEEQLVDAVRADVEELVAEVVGEGGAAGAKVPVRVRVVPGQPAAMLIEQAREADLLVVGHRGRGGFTSAVLGSVGLHSVLHATCPVTVVRPSPQLAAESSSG
jgi:nucleotide-binding universal stress UspA family protein